MAKKGEPTNALVDAYMKVEDERKALQKQADAKKNEAERIYNELILQMTNGGFGHVVGTHVICSIHQDVEPKGEDWVKIWHHIQETGEFELLHKRLTGSAVKERWEAGVEVPGVVRWPVVKLSFKSRV